MVYRSEATHRFGITSTDTYQRRHRTRRSLGAIAYLAIVFSAGIGSQASSQTLDGWTFQVERTELRFDTHAGGIVGSGRISALPRSGGSLGGAVEGRVTIVQGAVQAQVTAFAIAGGLSVPVARIKWPDDADRLQSGKFTLPTMTFHPLDNVDVRVSDVAIDYDIREPASRIKLSGSLAVRQWQGLVIDFSRPREISYQNGELQIHVRVSIDQLVRFSEQWSLGPSFIEFDVQRRILAGGTTWQTPYGNLAVALGGTENAKRASTAPQALQVEH